MCSFLENQKERGPLICGICNKTGLVRMCEIVGSISLVLNKEKCFAPVNTVVNILRHGISIVF